MPKKLGLFYVVLLTDPLYIQWYKFIIVQVTLPIPSHRVQSNIMLVFKRLHLNLLNIMIYFLDITLPYLEQFRPSSNQKIKSKPRINKDIVVSTVCGLSKQNLSQLIHQHFGRVFIFGLRRIEIKGLMKGLPTNVPDLGET